MNSRTPEQILYFSYAMQYYTQNRRDIFVWILILREKIVGSLLSFV